MDHNDNRAHWALSVPARLIVRKELASPYYCALLWDHAGGTSAMRWSKFMAHARVPKYSMFSMRMTSRIVTSYVAKFFQMSPHKCCMNIGDGKDKSDGEDVCDK